MNTVDRALYLVKQIVDQPMRLQEIADLLGIHKSSASRLVKTLEEHKFVKTINSVIYPGYGILNLAYKIYDSLDIRDITRSYIEKLGGITKGTIHLCILDGNEVVYIDKKDSPYPVRMHSRIGKRGPVYCTGVGKAILAFMPSREIERIVDTISFISFTPTTLSNKEDFMEELSKIKQSGISIDNGEHEEIVRCIAAPIFNFEGKPVAAVSISFTTTHNTFEELLKFRPLLLDMTLEISKELGYVDASKVKMP